jgi:hypothetical protein
MRRDIGADYKSYSLEIHAASLCHSDYLEVMGMRPGKQVPSDNIAALYHIFGNLDAETDIVVQSCLCSQALLNENTGVYGCRLMDCVCPYESPNPKRCLADCKFSDKYKKQIYVPKIPKCT